MREYKIKRVLKLVNKARKETGLPPLSDLPKGIRGSNWRCPIARALNHDVLVSDSFVLVTDPSIATAIARAFHQNLQGLSRVPSPRLIKKFVHELDYKRTNLQRYVEDEWDA